MVETIRYGLIALQDLALGEGSVEVTLADGRVVTLDRVRLTLMATGLDEGAIPFVAENGYPSQDLDALSWARTTDVLQVKAIKILAGGSIRHVDTNNTLIHAWGIAT